MSIKHSWNCFISHLPLGSIVYDTQRSMFQRRHDELFFCTQMISTPGMMQTCHSYGFYQYILFFLTVKFGKIQIFLPKIGWNTDFLLECQRFFLILSLFIQICFLKYWFFLVIYTDFVWDHSGRSAWWPKKCEQRADETICWKRFDRCLFPLVHVFEKIDQLFARDYVSRVLY